jgi:hypothetical protein
MSALLPLPAAHHPLPASGVGGWLREGVARRHGRNSARTTPRSTLRPPSNRPLDNPQAWCEKVGRSIKGSDTPHPCRTTVTRTCRNLRGAQHQDHPTLNQGASPDDPALAEYCARRRRRTPLPINKTTPELIEAQEGRSTICGGSLLAVDDRPQTPHQRERWLDTARQTINPIATRTPGTSDPAEPRPGHAAWRINRGLALHNAYEPSGLA